VLMFRFVVVLLMLSCIVEVLWIVVIVVLELLVFRWCMSSRFSGLLVVIDVWLIRFVEFL